MPNYNCRVCGKPLFEEIPFCPHCGAKQPPPLSEEEILKDPYVILQISKDAEPEVIEAAYKSLAKKYHPDKSDSPETQERMQEINWAYNILTDPTKRKQWKTKKETTRSDESEKKSQIKKERKFSEEPINRVPDEFINCPNCDKRITFDATVCPYCGKNTKKPRETTDKYPLPSRQSKKSNRNPWSYLLGLIIIGFLYLIINSNNQAILSKSTSTPQTQNIRLTNQAKSRFEIKTAKTQTALSVASNNSENSCIRFDRVNDSHLGKWICVYGPVVGWHIEKDEYGYNENFIIQFPENLFIIKSQYYFELTEGECIAFEGYISKTYAYYFTFIGNSNNEIYEFSNCN